MEEDPHPTSRALEEAQLMGLHGNRRTLGVLSPSILVESRFNLLVNVHFQSD